jgi:hypothetical protein
MVHIALSWNYDFDPALLNRMAASPENISYFLTTLFPNAGNLPLLWLGQGIVLGVALLLSRRNEIKVSPLASSAETTH